MWIMMSDSFLSLVRKDCPPGFVLVRARREGDIERVFGRHVKTERTEDADYLYRALLPAKAVGECIAQEIEDIDYDNFKNSVNDDALHTAYLRTWTAMASVQKPSPYSKPYAPRNGKKSRARRRV